jgi:putative peptidoglycan lipid II flippase
MNAPYDRERDAAGQMPPSPEQRPAPDPYPQGTYAYNPYQQDPAAQDPVDDPLYDPSAHPPPPAPYTDHGNGQWQQGEYAGVDGLTGAPGTGPQQPYDAYDHLFRDQRPGHSQAAAPDPRQEYGQYQEPQGYYEQQAFDQQGYQQPGYDPGRQPYAQAQGYDGRTYQDSPYAEQNAYGGQYGAQEYGGQQYADPRYDDPRYAYPFHQQYGDHRDGTLPPPDETGQIPIIQVPIPAPAPAEGGKAGGILKSSALMAAGTLVSRVTGFVRTLVIAAAIGVATLGDSYAVANTLPTMIYILTIGGGLNSVFVPQLVRAMKDDEDGGAAYANRLLTVVMVLLGGIVTVTVLGAPLLVRLMSAKIADNPDSYSVAITFARYCLPTIFFMGVHVVMGQVLNARGKFGAMMWTPVLNNVVVIFTFLMFIWVYGSYSTTRMDATTITPEGARLLGIGTLLGLVVQSLAMLPYLRDAGFRFRPRFDWRGHGLGHAAKLAKWTFFFVLANQAGLIVVTQLATWAGANADKSGYQGTGITAYNNALLIWQMPQAIITVSVMAAVLPRISRAAADGDVAAVRDDISYGLRTSAVAIVPAAFAFLALGVPMCGLLYSSTGSESARNIGFILMAFGVGLVPFSVQYVVLRGFYAFEDTRTPFYNTVVVAGVNAAASALCFFVLPARWAVVGMAASYGLAYAVGVRVAAKRLRARLHGDLDGRRVIRTYARLTGACVPAAAVAGVGVYAVLRTLGSGALGSMAALVVGGVLLMVLFLGAAKRMRIEELNAMIGMVRGRFGR